MLIDDGQCVIEVIYTSGYRTDSASLLDIGNAARQVMKKCIDLPNDPIRGDRLREWVCRLLGNCPVKLFVNADAVK